jgi:HEPN domain-containing protein
MDKRAETQEWIEFAERDLEAAKILANHIPVAREIVCCHCQQAVEKLLKAYLVAAETPFEKVHDLERIAAMCAPFDAGLERFNDAFRSLTVFGVVTRYPSSVEIAEADAMEALESSMALWEQLLPRIKARL